MRNIWAAIAFISLTIEFLHKEVVKERDAKEKTKENAI